MDRRLKALALLSLTVLVACQPTRDTEADILAIQAVREAEERASVAGDVDAMMALMTEDVRIMPPGGPIVEGMDAARAWADGFMNAFRISFTAYETEEVEVWGNLAVERFSGVWNLIPTGEGETVTERVKGIHVYARQADGSWKITHDVWNSDDPPPGI